MIRISNENPNIHKYIENIYCLDNFSAFSIKLGNLEFKTAEHAFQYMKFKDTAPKIAEQIRNALSPFEARNIAHVNKSLRRKDWSEVKYDIMENILDEKTRQNTYVKEKLLNTKDKEIVEDCGEDDDKDWGCGLDGTGQNNLGKIWIKIRDKYKKER